jgi:glycosyltransferase involved in cell wall biosynthesis
MKELFENLPGPDISIFIPCLNEEKKVVGAIEKISSACEDTQRSFEILVFDDGSTDRTSEIVEEYRLSHPALSISLVRRETNKGLAPNFIDGAFYAKGRYYRCVAGDDYESPEAHRAILRELGAADMIIPVYTHVENRGPVRTLISKAYTWAVNQASGFRIRYYNGFPVYHRWHVMRYGGEGTGFGFQAELITRLLNEGMTYKEIDLTAYYDGVTKAFTLRNFVSVSYSLFKILMRRVRLFLFR